MSETKQIAALSLDERRKLLEAAAEHAFRHYETDEELTAFTALDQAAGDESGERGL